MEPVAAGEHRAQRDARRPLQRNHQFSQRCRDKRQRNSLGYEPIAKARGITPKVVSGYVKARSRTKIGPELPHGGIESGARQQGCSIRRFNPERALMPKYQVEKATVGDLNTFGSAR